MIFILLNLWRRQTKCLIIILIFAIQFVRLSQLHLLYFKLLCVITLIQNLNWLFCWCVVIYSLFLVFVRLIFWIKFILDDFLRGTGFSLVKLFHDVVEADVRCRHMFVIQFWLNVVIIELSDYALWNCRAVKDFNPLIPICCFVIGTLFNQLLIYKHLQSVHNLTTSCPFQNRQHTI